MSDWSITFEGSDDHNVDTDPLAQNAHDFAIRDKAQALFFDIAKLTGNQTTKATVVTPSTGQIDFVPDGAEVDAVAPAAEAAPAEDAPASELAAGDVQS